LYRLKTIKEHLVQQVENQMSNLECVDAHELGEVIDMIKDLNEAMYYHSVVEAMEHKETQEDEERELIRILERKGMPEDTHFDYSPTPLEEHKHEYMKAREHHMDKETQMEHLEGYIHELSEEILDMAKEASIEEKQLMQKKLAVLATKVAV
jgi:cytosine/adenosine deaminase-related metal-dependent hydrolase